MLIEFGGRGLLSQLELGTALVVITSLVDVGSYGAWALVFVAHQPVVPWHVESSRPRIGTPVSCCKADSFLRADSVLDYQGSPPLYKLMHMPVSSLLQVSLSPILWFGHGNICVLGFCLFVFLFVFCMHLGCRDLNSLNKR